MAQKLVLTETAEKQLEEFEHSNPHLVDKIYRLLEAILANPRTGIGKPEQLKRNLSGYWSRRISKKHRIIYKIDTDSIQVVEIGGHYE